MLLPTALVQSQTRSSSDDRITFQMMEISVLLWESLENIPTGTRGSELGSGCFKKGPWEAMVGPDSTGPHSSSSVIFQWFGFLPVYTVAQQPFPAIPRVGRRRHRQAEADVPQAACIKVIIK